ncbi:hypothetical protein B0I35DRAFT_221446 [Stachybotrys elegans]|uniref:Uncharacterized protein n=1 Tax=Stachybotrys elegans TaxID=80388 RepID=A0A8K0STU3_9HYPO|nr:hypothetical protein B0I35DRAFT_221446 [Stachybotrys elegans]
MVKAMTLVVRRYVLYTSASCAGPYQPNGKRRRKISLKRPMTTTTMWHRSLRVSPASRTTTEHSIWLPEARCSGPDSRPARSPPGPPVTACRVGTRSSYAFAVVGASVGCLVVAYSGLRILSHKPLLSDQRKGSSIAYAPVCKLAG